MTQLYFRHQSTGKRYKIVAFDKEAGVVVLKGPTTEFREPYDKERFARMGYVLEREETEDA